MSDLKFKTIYFPKHRVRSGCPARVNISIPNESNINLWESSLIEKFISASGAEMRSMIGDPFLDDIEAVAENENCSLSNAIFKMLLCVSPSHSEINKKIRIPAQSLKPKTSTSIGVTFSDSLRKGVFGWYPYVEGFSANYARDAILRAKEKPSIIYDPFGGSGTTQLAASQLGIASLYSELNPFMAEVSEAKVTSSFWAKKNYNQFNNATEKFLNLIEPKKLDAYGEEIDLSNYLSAFPERDFFEESHIRQLLAALEAAEIASEGNTHIARILKIACTANAVSCSNMTRRADLRRRRSDEYKNRIVNVSSMISSTARRMLVDVLQLPDYCAPTKKISSDAKKIPENHFNTFDMVLTSPPYLNGTNYFRNTKIELWLLSFIKNETELKIFREATVTGGINDVCKKESYYKFSNVEKIAEQLDLNAKDKRIPMMVRHYFSDMYEVLCSVYFGMRKNGTLILDIGDSKFYGIHVPTHNLLIDVAAQAGLKLRSENTLAKRLSRDKTELVQVELIFEKD